jgi:hypothetical protein
VFEEKQKNKIKLNLNFMFGRHKAVTCEHRDYDAITELRWLVTSHRKSDGFDGGGTIPVTKKTLQYRTRKSNIWIDIPVIVVPTCVEDNNND